MSGTAELAAPRKGLPAAFLLIVLSRVVAMFGVQLSTFALGVWVFQRSGAAADYAVLAAMAVLPALLVLPLSGTVTDRWGFQRVLPAVALADALTTAGVFGLAWLGVFQPAHAYVSTFLLGIGNAFLGPAMLTMARTVVAEEHLGRSNGALQLAWALTTLVGPVAAGLLMAKIGFVNVLAIDAASAVVAGAVLVAALAALPQATTEAADAGGDWRAGWDATRADPVLLATLGAMLAGFTAFNALRVLLPPFVLGRHDATALGWVMALAGAGMLVGSVAVAVGGGDRRPARAIMAANVLIGATCVTVGLVPRLPAVMAGAFGVALFTIVGLMHTDLIFQQRIPLALQGRAAAFRQFLASLCYVLTAFAAGPAVDRLFEPALATRGTWANALGTVWGYGTGCGIALMWSGLGAALLLVLALIGATGSLKAQQPGP